MNPKDHIEAIRADYLVKYFDQAGKPNRAGNSAFNSFRLNVRSFTDPLEFVLELIQNAEDERANKIEIKLENERIIVHNNGRPFNEADVDAICGVGNSKKSLEKIGYWGVGFKSCFTVSSTPIVISGEYSFAFDDETFVIPRWVDNLNIKDFPRDGATVVLPLNKPKFDLKRFATLIDSLNERLLLFLKNLKNIEVANHITGMSRILSCSRRQDVATLSVNGETASKWLLHSKTLEIPDPILETLEEGDRRRQLKQRETILAFGLDARRRLLPQRDKMLYAYVPTKYQTNTSFIIQSDFVVEPSRETAIEYNPWNEWLLSEAAAFLAECAEKIFAKHSRYRFTFYLCLPREEEMSRPLTLHFFTALRQSLDQKRFIVIQDGSRQRLSDSYFADSTFQDLISQRELSRLLGRSCYYVHQKVQGQEILRALGVKNLGPNDLVKLFHENPDFLKNKHLDYFRKLYKYLHEDRKEITENSWALLLKTPLIINQAGELIVPSQQQVYLSADQAVLKIAPFEINPHLQFVHKIISLQKPEDPALKFLRLDLKIPYLTPHKAIEDLVIPTLSQDSIKISDGRRVELTAFLMEHMDEFIKNRAKTKSDRDELLRQFVGKILLKSKSGKLIPGSELYFSTKYAAGTDMGELFRGIRSVEYISPIYLDLDAAFGPSAGISDKRRKSWVEFFETLGVSRIPKVISLQGDRDKFHRYLKSSLFCSDWYAKTSNFFASPDIGKIIKTRDHRKLKMLFQILHDNWRQYYKAKIFSSFECRHVTHGRVEVESLFAFHIKNSSWVLSSKGLGRPGSVFISDPRIQHDLGDYVPYLDKDLPIRNKGFLGNLGIKTEIACEDYLMTLETVAKARRWNQTVRQRLKRIYQRL